MEKCYLDPTLKVKTEKLYFINFKNLQTLHLLASRYISNIS